MVNPWFLRCVLNFAEVVHLAAARLLQQGTELPWPCSVFFGDLPIRDARRPSHTRSYEGTWVGDLGCCRNWGLRLQIEAIKYKTKQTGAWEHSGMW